MQRALLLLALLALSACSGEPDEAAEAIATDVPKSFTAAPIANAAVQSGLGTPLKDRVATLGLLNKRNNLTQDLLMKPGEARRIGNVIVKLASCERTLPWETPPETGAFVQVFVEERAGASDPLAWRKVFSGWLYKNTPSLNVVEHPVYDVWVKDCAMKFPGEEEDAAAAASSAPKPSGKPSPPAAPPTAPPASPPASPTPEVPSPSIAT